MNLETRLQVIEGRILEACERSNRPRQSVMLLAVSKTKLASDILALAKLGQHAFGENYLQEAIEKITHLADSPECPSLTWHFIGPIQSNKTRPIAEYFDWVHSVDRLKIAQRLSDQRPRSKSPLNIFIQVNTSAEASKSGVAPDEALELANNLRNLPNVKLRGFMTIPSTGNQTEQLAKEFEICRQLLRQASKLDSDINMLSMGMSNDLDLAIEHGSTCIRVGTALFGERQ